MINFVLSVAFYLVAILCVIFFGAFVGVTAQNFRLVRLSRRNRDYVYPVTVLDAIRDKRERSVFHRHVR